VLADITRARGVHLAFDVTNTIMNKAWEEHMIIDVTCPFFIVRYHFYPLVANYS